VCVLLLFIETLQISTVDDFLIPCLAQAVSSFLNQKFYSKPIDTIYHIFSLVKMALLLKAAALSFSLPRTFYLITSTLIAANLLQLRLGISSCQCGHYIVRLFKVVEYTV
jgi:hypothetical protein